MPTLLVIPVINTLRNGEKQHNDTRPPVIIPAHSQHSQNPDQKICLQSKSSEQRDTKSLYKFLSPTNKLNNPSIIMRNKPTITPGTLLIKLLIPSRKPNITRQTI